MKKIKRLKSFTIYADITINCGIDIKAESIEDAIEKSRKLDVTDFVEIFGDYNDGSITIQGVFENK